MLTQGRLTEYLREHPGATNQQLAEDLNEPEGNVRAQLCKLKKRGVIMEETDEAGRKFTVLKETPKRTYDFKRSMLMDMCEAYYEDFMDAELFTERVEIGKMICRILEKI